MDILTLENNSYCSERVSPRRLRGNKILPPECHYILQSYCNQRISPRRQRNGCEEFAEDILLANVATVTSTATTTPSSPTLTPSSFTSQSIQREGTPENQGVSVPQIPQIVEPSSQNISEVSQVETSRPSSPPLTRMVIEAPSNSPLPFRGRGESIDVILRVAEFRDEMIDIESIEPYVPHRDLVVDLTTITGRFEIIMQKGLFEEDDQKHLFAHLDNLSESATEVLQKNIDIQEIKQKTIETYTDATRIARESIASNPVYRGPITIQTTGDLQAVLDEARRISDNLKTVTRNVPEQPTTSTTSGTVSVVDETAGTTAEDIEEMIDTIFKAFDTVVDRSQNYR